MDIISKKMGKIGTVREIGNSIYFNFGGSNNEPDYWVSAKCWVRDGLYHAGIDDIFQECIKELLPLCEDKVVMILGYSVGGMLGQRLLYELIKSSYMSIFLQTKGSPKVLTKKAIKEIMESPSEITIIRTVYGNDPAPVIFPGYTHLGILQPIGPKRVPGAWLLPKNWKDHTGYFGD